MQNIFDQPDLELALRGRPTDLQPLRIQVLASADRRDTRFPHRHAGIVARRAGLLAGIVILSVTAAFLIARAYPSYFVARISLEVTPPASASVVTRRALALRTIDGCAQAVELATLPEYASPRSAWERFTHTQSALPREEDLLRAVEQRVTFQEAGGGRVVDVDFPSSDPSRATAFLDLLAQEIERDHEDARADAVRQARQSLDERLLRARTELDQAEVALLTGARAGGLLDQQTASLADERLRQGRSPTTGETNRFSPAIEQARSRIAALRTQHSIRLEALRHEFETRRAAYDALQKTVRDAESQAAATGTVRPLAAARLISTPSNLPALVIALLGALGGLLIGIPLCLFRDITDHVVRDPADVPAEAPVPLLGVIPHAALRKAPRLGPGVPDLTGFPLFSPGPMQSVREVRSESLSEAFRHVLASIWIAGQNNRRARVLLVTSPGAREGKTTAVVNLGIALANTRRRVLILDANMRRPHLHMMFGAPPTWGLANLLESDQPVEDYSFEDVVFKTNIAGLYVLPAGSGHLSIAGMSHVDRLTELLARFRLEFHAVLIDTPSACDYPEARILARLSDAAVLILRADRSRKHRVSTLVHQLNDDGATVLGAVLNDYRSVH